MQCKIKHEDVGAIPWDLCRCCQPHLYPKREQSVAPTDANEAPSEVTTRYAKRKLREVRKEVRELQHQLELMQKYPTPKTQIKAVEEKLRSAQRELYLNA